MAKIPDGTVWLTETVPGRQWIVQIRATDRTQNPPRSYWKRHTLAGRNGKIIADNIIARQQENQQTGT